MKTVRKNFWELLWMKVPLCSKLWIEEKCANLPVSNLHLQAHPVALYVSNCPCQPQGSEVMDPALVPCVTEPRLQLAPPRAVLGVGTVSCHRSSGSATPGRGQGDNPQSPAPFGTCAGCRCCSAQPSSMSLWKRGAASPGTPVAAPCAPVRRRDPERALTLHALHNPSLKGY